MVGKGVHGTENRVGDDVTLGTAHQPVGVADLDLSAVTNHRLGVRNRVGAIGDSAALEVVEAIVRVVVSVAQRNRPENPMFLQAAEVDADVLLDDDRGIGRD